MIQRLTIFGAVLLALVALVALAWRMEPAPTPEASREVRPALPDPGPWEPAYRSPLPVPLGEAGIVVTKSRHTLELFSGSTLLRTYPVGLGMNPVDPKRRQWDLCTPEGHYLICAKNPNSKYTLGLVLNYPSADDARRGVREGLISASEGDAILAALRRGECPPMNTPLGGDIVIHGRGAGNDWTAGCVALEDGDVRELYGAVEVGTPVEIRH